MSFSSSHGSFAGTYSLYQLGRHPCSGKCRKQRCSSFWAHFYGIHCLPDRHYNIFKVLYSPANDSGLQMIPVPQMIPRPEMIPSCTANDPPNGNGIFAANEGNEWTQEFGQWIYFIHFFSKLPTANLNGTGSIGSTSKM